VGRHIILAEFQRRRESGQIIDAVTGDASSSTDDSNDTSPDVARGPNGVAASLWRGDVPLYQTYWVCGVLTNLLWGIPIGLAEAADLPILVLVLVGLNLIYLVFIAVAIWRSATRYSGRKLWGDLARLSVTLGLIRTLAALFA
jgi:hypothetical protein